MQKLLIIAAVVVAVVGCKPREERLGALQCAEVERRAEVQEAQRETGKLDAEQRRERAELAGEQAEDRAEVYADSAEEIAEATDKAAEKRSALSAERTSFQEKGLRRLDEADARAAEVQQKLATSGKINSPRFDNDVQDAAVVRANIVTLKEKLPAMMQVTSDATWSMTKKSLEKQIDDVEAMVRKLDGPF